MTSPVIKPTIGRRVWFRPSAEFLASNPILTQFNPEQPMDAGIVYVHHDHMVNLIVTDHVCKTLAVPSVPLLGGHYVAGEDVTEWATMAKLKAGRLNRLVPDTCLQFWGGMGFTWDNKVSRMYRDGRLASIGGGADEVMLGILAKIMGIAKRPAH